MCALCFCYPERPFLSGSAFCSSYSKAEASLSFRNKIVTPFPVSDLVLSNVSDCEDKEELVCGDLLGPLHS